MKLPPSIRRQIEEWFDIEWGVMSMKAAKNLSDSILRQYEIVNDTDQCIVLMIVCL